MSKSINWVGNKVLDPIPYQPAESSSAIPQDSYAQRTMPMPQSAYSQQMMPVQQSGYALTPVQMQQGGYVSSPLPATQGSLDIYDTQEGPPPATERGYIPYYLASNIGKNVRAEFIIGSNQYMDKTGILTEVGINYFVLYDVSSRNYVMCDLYSVKFVTILPSR
ncbi:MAG: hypothetical protein GX488_04000 [Clostridiales bacterium]|nr:hypothetical protein [Clostridiales bacterium]